FENVSEIGIEFEREGKIHCRASIVMNSEPLLTGSLPKNLRAKDVHCSPRKYRLAVPEDIRVCCIYRQNGIVFSDGRTEQKRPGFSKVQFQAKQKSSVLRVHAEFTGTEGIDIAESIEHCEGVSLFENAGTNVNAR